MAPTAELVRVVATAEHGLAVGRALPGRGAWVCRASTSCLDAAGRRNAFARALRTDIAPGALDALRAALAERGRIEGQHGTPGSTARERKET